VSAGEKLLVEVRAEVLQAVRQHARSNMNAEVCGVWLGTLKDGVTQVEARIPGEGAAQGGAHVTFTHETWEHIYRVKDQKFPGLAIVGWYHSHPGFGVFLSEYDLFIHKNFFSNPGQVAWVFDPHSDEEGCFVWAGGEIVRVSSISIKDERAGGGKAEGPKSEGTPPGASASGGVVTAPAKRGGARWLGRAGMIRLGIFFGFVLGVIAGFYLQDHGEAVSGPGMPPKATNRVDGGRTNAAAAQNVTGTNMPARATGGKKP